MWSAWSVWKAANWRPSEAYRVANRDIAVDLDNAVALFGRHVEHEIETGIDDLKSKALKKGSGKKKKTRMPSRQEIEHAADRVWARLVRRKLIWRFAATDSASDRPEVGGHYTVERDLTSDPIKDRAPWHHGARRVIWDDGRVEEYGEDGQRIA